VNRGERRAAWTAAHRAGPSADRPTLGGGRLFSGVPPAKPAIRVEIGALVLHGFPRASRHEIGDALQTELTRLIVAGGVPAAYLLADGTRRMTAPDAQTPSTATPAAIGREIAGSIYRGNRT
jgi:hypothetical protein